MILRGLCTLLLALAASAAMAADVEMVPIPQRKMIDWRSNQPNADRIRYTGTGLTITFTSVHEPDTNTVTPVLHLRSASGEQVNALGTSQFGQVATARFGIGELDPTNDTPEIVFSSYTGGAHCCTLVVVLSHTAIGWVRAVLGPVDGDPMDAFPRDADGDALPELITIDHNFLYAFESYAGSYAPPAIYQIRFGRLVDASKNAHYTRLYEVDYKSARAGCEKHGNGACAAMVADGSRLGIRDQAWAIMLRNYDRNSTWTLPQGCSTQLVNDACPKGKEVQFASYPDALNWFLNYYGY